MVKHLKDDQRIVVSRYRNPPLVIPYVSHKPYSKPLGSLLWYGQGDEWLHYLSTNLQSKLQMFIHEIFIDQSKMCVLKTEDDIDTFYKRYMYDKEKLNWDIVAQEYAGIECFGEGFKRSGWQYSWDDMFTIQTLKNLQIHVILGYMLDFQIELKIQLDKYV